MHSENVFYAIMCTKKRTLNGIGAFLMVRLVCASFVWPVFLAVVYILVQTNVAPNAFRTSSIIPQYMFKFGMAWTKFVSILGLMFQ